MSRTNKHSRKRGGGRKRYRITVEAVRRDPPDLRKLGRALIHIAMEQAAAEAAAEAEANERTAAKEEDPDA